jgi:acyl transferase domain-containing protein
LTSNEELITPGPPARWDIEQTYSPAGGIGRVATRFGTYVHSTFAFDTEAFGLTVGEAALMDPQQRVLLEETVSAFTAAGGKSSCTAAGQFTAE